ncbi:Fe3+-citrate ABC transporter substrate-binding protein [Mycolicibacterium doricum]|uniref:Fe3+-citrate ABC transporter substrate-binding protein n=1 Tax=Mycolicibacterium doricum TaxID=126673 RepID=A0A1X1TFZ4_9MYCO|nr:iron-siderophore ABC transporter substrate-binding protein [Mycolicibacterium doricum]MCV7266803.1 iron-siderophore ABC transporter substrate-binding protein [Mycolicibacterium doricum]ORV43475.1 Fe3+-citrate ABC transporter substrate-binding protein [Mycolicibacterium doricum]BBZ07082.1 Fe3+-citrate ABC transporter substrate-binding protein [Mycolicibacterium doricum]
MVSAALVATLAAGLAGCGSTDGDAASSTPMTSIITSTTSIAGADVLGNERRPDESCAPEPARVDPGPPEREVRHAAGQTRVTADPQRIVVLSGDQLDALCALGLQTRIVAAALPDGRDEQPSYLGAVIHDVAPAGTRSAPDVAAIRAAAPNLILGSQASTPELFGELSAIAPTVFTGPPGADWQANLRTVGAATGRFDAVGGLLDGFADAARRTGTDNDAAHFQASVVQLTDDTVRVYGADNFPGSVLAEVGLDRPAAQRFTDEPFVELGTGNKPDYSIADADIVYVSFDSPAARDNAPQILDSDAWRALSAAQDDRVFVVNNEVWQTGQGIVAARGILADIRWVNAPIN